MAGAFTLFLNFVKATGVKRGPDGRVSVMIRGMLPFLALFPQSVTVIHMPTRTQLFLRNRLLTFKTPQPGDSSFSVSFVTFTGRTRKPLEVVGLHSSYLGWYCVKRYSISA